MTEKAGSGRLLIRVLGPGCVNCHRMRDMAMAAVSELGVDAEVEYVSDLVEIMKHVAYTPGLVVNGKVKHSGRPLPSGDMVRAMIKEEI